MLHAQDRKIRLGLPLMAVLGWMGAATSSPASPPTLGDVRVLRVAINYGNAVLARRDEQTGQLSGVSVDIAQEFARQLGRPVELIGFDAANRAVQALRDQRVEVGFFAIDPARSEGLRFTPAYVVIEGAYVVPASSRIQNPQEVDQPGVRVAVAERSAYDLYLSRTLKQAQLVKTVRSSEVVNLMFSRELEVAAGVKQQLEKDMQIHPNLRMLKPSFMQIQQAMATSESNPALHSELVAFLARIKASGFIQSALQRHRIEGVSIAP